MIALRAHGVDFTAHLLSDETEFLALALRSGERFEEVVEVLPQPLFLLVDVEFLDVENHFLLEAPLVVVYLGNGSEAIGDARTDLYKTLRLVARHLGEQVGDTGDAHAEELLELFPLHSAIGADRVERRIKRLHYGIALLAADFLHGIALHGIGETQQRGIPVVGLRQPEFGRHCLDLLLIPAQSRQIELHGSRFVGGLHMHRQFDLATLQTPGGDVAHVGLKLTIARGDADGKIHLLAVERFYFKSKLFGPVSTHGTTESGHR